VRNLYFYRERYVYVLISTMLRAYEYGDSRMPSFTNVAYLYFDKYRITLLMSFS